MVQSVLASLGILLLMHLVINTVYHFQQQKKLSNRLVPILHISIVSMTVITMFNYPIKLEAYYFNLGLIPIIFIAFFHSWKYTVPVLIIVSFYRFIIGGEGTVQEIFLGIIAPTILAMSCSPFKLDKISYLKPFIIVTACWLISILSILSIISINEYSILFFGKMALFQYLSFALASFIMYFFIYTGINHLEIVKKLQFYAEHDPLTCLYNMRRFEEIVNLHANNKKQMFIAMVDIDRFKSINDTYGHQTGDYAIQSVSKIILKHCSRQLYAGRYGGDEFILFIMADSLKDATKVLNSIREVVSETSIIPIGSKQHCQLSLSIGISPLIDPFHLKTSIEKADQQLYLAKQSGRNCICG